MSLGVVIQARMGSSRLPGKVLRQIGDRPLLSHVVGRLEALGHAASIVVATSDLPRDDVIVTWCVSVDVACFRGSEADVLDRYLRCAETYGFSEVVRLTADNPFTDVAELDRLIDLHRDGGYDYSHSFGVLPIGVGAEIFTVDALRRSHAEGHALHHREHVNEYIPEHPESFHIGVLDVPLEKRAPDLRLTVDTEADWRLACHLAEQVRGGWLKTVEAIALCSRSA